MHNLTLLTEFYVESYGKQYMHILYNTCRRKYSRQFVLVYMECFIPFNFVQHKKTFNIKYSRQFMFVFIGFIDSTGFNYIIFAHNIQWCFEELESPRIQFHADQLPVAVFDSVDKRLYLGVKQTFSNPMEIFAIFQDSYCQYVY